MDYSVLDAVFDSASEAAQWLKKERIQTPGKIVAQLTLSGSQLKVTLPRQFQLTDWPQKIADHIQALIIKYASFTVAVAMIECDLRDVKLAAALGKELQKFYLWVEYPLSGGLVTALQSEQAGAGIKRFDGIGSFPPLRAIRENPPGRDESRELSMPRSSTEPPPVSSPKLSSTTPARSSAPPPRPPRKQQPPNIK